MGNFREFTGNSLFLFCLRWLFPVSGCVDGAGLGFRLGFGWIDFAGLAPLPTTGRFVYWHNCVIFGVTHTNIPASCWNLAAKLEKSEKKSTSTKKAKSKTQSRGTGRVKLVREKEDEEISLFKENIYCLWKKVIKYDIVFLMKDYDFSSGDTYMNRFDKGVFLI